MPECSNILYRLSQSCPHCNAAYRYCLFLNFTSHFLFSEDKWRSNILCLKVVLIYIYNLALSHHPCSFLKTPLVTYYEDLPYWQRYYVLPFFDSHNRNTCWLSLRKSQFGRIFVHFVRSFTGENKGHPFPVQVHVLLEEEAEDHLHQIHLVKRGDKKVKKALYQPSSYLRIIDWCVFKCLTLSTLSPCFSRNVLTVRRATEQAES